MPEDAERAQDGHIPGRAATRRWTKAQAELLGFIMAAVVMDAGAVISGVLGYYGTRGCNAKATSDSVCSNDVMYGQFGFALFLTGLVVTLLLVYTLSRWRSNHVRPGLPGESAARGDARAALDKQQVSDIMWGQCTNLLRAQMKRMGG